MSDAKTILITGPKFSGKSRFVEMLLPRLREAGFTPTGFFQRGVFDGSGVKIGYDLVNVENGLSIPLARRAVSVGSWEFDEQAFARATGMVSPAADVCVLDEIGPLELSGGGHARTLKNALEEHADVILVVREELADELRRRIPVDHEVAVEKFSIETQDGLVKDILAILRA